MCEETTYLDWSKTARVQRLGTAGRCITCDGPTIILNPDGLPQHKTCAEADLDSVDAAEARYFADDPQTRAAL